MSRQTLTCVLVAAVTFGAPSSLSPAKGARSDVTADALLAAVYEEIIRGHLDAALQNIEGLIRVRPNFRLAHLIKGDVRSRASRPINTIGAAPTYPGRTWTDSGRRSPACEPTGSARLRDRIPRYLLQLREDQRIRGAWSTRAARGSICTGTTAGRRARRRLLRELGKERAAESPKETRGRPSAAHVTRASPAEALGLLRQRRLPDRLPGTVGPHSGAQRPPASGCTGRLRTPTAGLRVRVTAVSCLANSDLDGWRAAFQIGVTPVIISEDIEWLRPRGLGDRADIVRKAGGTVAGRLGKPRHRALPRALFEELLRAEPGPGQLEPAQAPRERRQELDQRSTW